jgi:membrane protease subunit HflK
MFEAMYSEYANNREITRSRMYYEVLNDMLPDVKVYIDTQQNGVSKVLPLESLIDNSTANKQTAAKGDD